MSVLTWDNTGERFYETGVNHGVLYPMTKEGKYGTGVVWNGLTAVNESPSGAEPTALYADNIKYLNLMSAEEFGATIEAYTYPDEFAECDGSAELEKGIRIGQQTRKSFGLCYSTKVGNDVDGEEYGEKIHIIYGALASPSAKDYATINESPEAITFSWELMTTPIPVKGHKPTAYLVIDTKTVSEDALALIKDKLYGTEDTEPTLPTPDEIAELVKNH